MRRILIILALALPVGLGGCAKFWQDVEAIAGAATATTSAGVSQKAAFAAVRAFDGLEISATNCLNMVAACRAPAARDVIVPTIRSGIIVRDKVVDQAEATPAGQNLKARADFDALQSAVSTLRQILQQYGVAQ